MTAPHLLTSSSPYLLRAGRCLSASLVLQRSPPIMTFRQYVQRLRQSLSLAFGGRRRRHPRKLSAHPCLEILEDRTVLSVDLVNSFSGLSISQTIPIDGGAAP